MLVATIVFPAIEKKKKIECILCLNIDLKKDYNDNYTI
jgi:hypothetical protein